MSTEFRLKRESAESAYEVAKAKDPMVIHLKERKFFAISTKDFSENDAYWINVQKQQIKDKYNLHRELNGHTNVLVRKNDTINMGSEGKVGTKSMNTHSGGSFKDHVDSMNPPSKHINGVSVLERFQEFINIGQAMGFGMGGKEKKQWVKSLCHSNDVNFLSLQETKMTTFDVLVVKAIWELNLKRNLWSYMSGLIHRWHGEVVAMGDFNEVRFASERYGSIFHASNAAEFKTFIASSHLIDVPLGGISFGLWSFSILFVSLLVYGHDFVSVVEDSWINDGVSDSNAMAIEGDENSKFFHGIVNKKRRQQAIKDPDWSRLPIEGTFSRCLRPDNSRDLEGEVSDEEIKKAVWDCGSDKSPGPAGFTFELFKKFWYLIGGDVTNVVKEFFNSSTFPNGCNSSFISLIHKVLDAKHLNNFHPISLIGFQYKIIGKILANRLSLVIDDIVSHEQSSFIKAFDLVRWDHLDDILGKFGFGDKWRGWIRGFLQSLKALVLINGSPTDEFLFHRGLRLYGVGVRCSDVQMMADMFGCLANNIPFTYLGVKVGANTARINAWHEVTQKVTSKLSKWKAKTLSVGGRLTLLKSVLGSLPTYYMSLFKVSDGVLNKLEGLRNAFFLGAEIDDRKMTWVRWKKVMAQKQYGGLGVSSLFASNRALLFKWIRRFYTSHSGLWLDVIKAIYGLKGVSISLFNQVIENGNNSSLWHEKWIGNECFKAS
uniref:RNA-directed DNA polymerase, eukaryota, reverse transcriptase zinc-binding domain protein n=1 Tax=Tanacetum cinerariifolium TaxID=118510 RepID=A0A699HBF6_TANCI|nr:RNA-directed DNA polymerase, eukaryota, reverse transcriptase zinc-binding domain protein [Tanacetum cinerariifolium]